MIATDCLPHQAFRAEPRGHQERVYKVGKRHQLLSPCDRLCRTTTRRSAHRGAIRRTDGSRALGGVHRAHGGAHLAHGGARCAGEAPELYRYEPRAVLVAQPAKVLPLFKCGPAVGDALEEKRSAATPRSRK